MELRAVSPDNDTHPEKLSFSHPLLTTLLKKNCEFRRAKGFTGSVRVPKAEYTRAGTLNPGYTITNAYGFTVMVWIEEPNFTERDLILEWSQQSFWNLVVIVPADRRVLSLTGDSTFEECKRVSNAVFFEIDKLKGIRRA